MAGDPFCPRQITFTIPGKVGVQVTITENEGKLDFVVDVLGEGQQSADLRGLFFHFNELQLGSLQIVGGDGLITGTQIKANKVIDLGQGNNMQGKADPFDVGIAFGTPGKGKDFIDGPIHFTLSNAGNNLTLDDIAHLQFGARLTSTGDKITAIAPAAPDAKDDTFNIFEDGASGADSPSKSPTPVVFDVVKNDTDADGDQLIITGFHDGPAHGTVAISADGHSVLYTPFLDYAGTDSFEYCVSDGHGGEDHATVNVNIAAVADDSILLYQILPGATIYDVVIHLTANQNDLDGSEFIDRIDLSGLPSGVMVSPGGINPADQPGQIVQDFVLSLPHNTDTKFDLNITAFSQELSNSDQETVAVSIPIELDINHNATTQTFVALDQSIWGIDVPLPNLDKFIGVDQPIDIDETLPVSIVPPVLINVDADGLFKAGLQVGIHLNAGEIDATLPFDITIDTVYNKTTHALLISSTAALDPSAFFDTVGPEGSVVLKALIDAFLNVNVDVVGDFTGLTDISVSTPHVSDSFDIFSFDSANAALTVPLPFPGATLNLAWPHVSTHGVSTGTNTLFDSEPSNNVLTLDMDLDTMAISYFPLLAPIDPNPLDPDNPELFDTHINGGVNFIQAFTLLAGLTAEIQFEDGTSKPFFFGQDLPVDVTPGLDADHDGLIEFSLALVPHANLTNQTDIGFNVGFIFDLFHNVPLIDDLVPTISETLPLGQINIFKGSFDLALNTQSYDFFA